MSARLARVNSTITRRLHSFTKSFAWFEGTLKGSFKEIIVLTIPDLLLNN